MCGGLLFVCKISVSLMCICLHVCGVCVREIKHYITHSDTLHSAHLLYVLGVSEAQPWSVVCYGRRDGPAHASDSQADHMTCTA